MLHGSKFISRVATRRYFSLRFRLSDSAYPICCLTRWEWEWENGKWITWNKRQAIYSTRFCTRSERCMNELCDSLPLIFMKVLNFKFRSLTIWEHFLKKKSQGKVPDRIKFVPIRASFESFESLFEWFIGGGHTSLDASLFEDSIRLHMKLLAYRITWQKTFPSTKLLLLFGVNFLSPISILIIFS